MICRRNCITFNQTISICSQIHDLKILRSYSPAPRFANYNHWALLSEANTWVCLLAEAEVIHAWHSQGRSQPHSPGWARVPLSSFFPQIWIKFSYFSAHCSHFLPHFDPPGGQVAHPGRPWLRHLAFTLTREVKDLSPSMRFAGSFNESETSFYVVSPIDCLSTGTSAIKSV